MLPKLSGLRQPGMRKAGTASSGAGSGGAAAAITLADAGGYYTTDDAESALQQLGPLLAGGGAAGIATTDVGGYYTTDNVEASLQQLGPLLAGIFASRVAVSPPATTSGVLAKWSLTPGADTGTTASTEAPDADFNLARTRTWATGALTTQRAVRIRQPTYAFAGASTLTTAATLAIDGPPLAGANATITNAYSLWTLSGTVRNDLADAATTTAPDGQIYRHTTSGTAAAGFGFLTAYELQTGGGNVRRVATDSVSLVTATDGSEELRRTFYLMSAGTLAAVGAFGWGNGTGGTLYLGDPTNATGIRGYPGPNRVDIVIASVPYAIFTGSAATVQPTVVLNTDRVAMAPIATTSGVLTKCSLTPAADTGTTASTEAHDVYFNLSRTRTWATGALATQRAIRINPPTYAFVAASTITDTATVAIDGAPIAGANATLTRAYGLWTKGITRLDGGVALGAGAGATLGTIGGSGPTVATQNKWLPINVDGVAGFLPYWV